MASEAPASRTKVIAVVGFYMVSALVMVFVNKAVLNSNPNLPFSFLFIQIILAVLLLHVVSLVSNLFKPGQGIELPAMDIKVAWQLTPLVAIGVCGLAFNTLCLRSVDASFFQIARGLQLPLTILVTAIQTRVFPRRPVITASAIVTAGFFLGIAPSSYFSSAPSPIIVVDIGGAVTSLVYGFLSSLMIALHAVMVKPAYVVVGGSTIKLAYWTNLLGGLFLIPFILLNGELVPLAARFHSNDSDWHVFVLGTAVTGVFGFLLCMAGLLSITNTSPTTHMFSSAARSVLQTVLGATLFGDIITSNRATSISVITAGAVYFTWIKSSGFKQPTPPPNKLVFGEGHKHAKSEAGGLPLPVTASPVWDEKR